VPFKRNLHRYNKVVKRPDLSKALWLMTTQYISSMTVPEHKVGGGCTQAALYQLKSVDPTPSLKPPGLVTQPLEPEAP
jgi:hypothetical protein